MATNKKLILFPPDLMVRIEARRRRNSASFTAYVVDATRQRLDRDEERDPITEVEL